MLPRLIIEFLMIIPIINNSIIKEIVPLVTAFYNLSDEVSSVASPGNPKGQKMEFLLDKKNSIINIYFILFSLFYLDLLKNKDEPYDE